ncbi:EAL domain-containing protein [Novosphingobium sp. 1949]|uniref:EAL domain-containing protein n=1 Tax=Novosphingobium organovorum TaxID=2930092 RepID=A0ABT0B9I2_9SPHN|nr:EAL domain-containing protein [Novosphingobium organovorum]MCJ2181599.1 EAL domain-containing protein [Novosphingobium organovorum]
MGLTDPDDGDWVRLRGMQFSALPQASAVRRVTQIIAMLAVFALCFGHVEPFVLAGWFLVTGTVLWRSYRITRNLAGVDRRGINRREVDRLLTGCAVNALAWAMPLPLFGPFIDPALQMRIWAILAVLMTASAVLMPAVPMAALFFGVLVGGSSALFFLFAHAYDMAAISLVLAGIVIWGAAKCAQRFLHAKIAEAGISEKDEVVSMLLREYEEGEADWLWQTDTARRVRSVSPRFAYALGREAGELEGKPFIELIAGACWETGDFHAGLRELAERIKRRESFSNLLVRVVIGGQTRWWELSGTPKLDENGAFIGFRGVGSDETEARESSDKIAYLARYDTLTGLPNRMMLTEALGDALDYAETWRTRCAFLMIDLDRFKAVNDTLGHLVGDQLLARVSERLREQMGEHDICARLGGDEFAIVVRDASDARYVEALAVRVIERLAQPYEVDHHTLYVGASIGSAVGPHDGANVETLMRNADLALYRAKDGGGNAHHRYEPALHASAEERRKLEFSLRHALERRELSVAFQPVVDADTESVVSFEALVRWNSAEHGFVSPAKFIPLAEDTRLIVPIGEWVLREACHEAMNWPSHVRVAVNVSGEQLLDHNFAASVVSALAESGLPPHRLEVEVTESIFLRDGTMANQVLERIMSLGCGVALDDFGTGYSSLGYLRKLRFSTIKIDRSFVQGAASGNAESIAIIRAVVAMAESLDMSTTAEGAETDREVEIIRKLGCRKIQGYFFGRPMGAMDAREIFKSRHYLDRQRVA